MPAGGRRRVFVQEVPAGVGLLAVQLAHELQVHHGPHVLAPHDFRIAPGVVEGLPGAVARAHGRPNQEHGLFAAELLSCRLSSLGLVEVP